MTLMPLALILILVALLPACSDKQKAVENKQATVQKELTLEEKFARVQKEAEGGGAEAQYNLGVRYKQGDGVSKDVTKAVEWFQKAAAQGSAEAHEYLGEMYKRGQDVSKDGAKAAELYRKALELYRKAADQGNAEAQNALGLRYRWGIHVPRDVTKAAEWYQKAAVQGNAEAQNALGEIYEIGDSAPKDAVKAVEWYQKAAAQGHVGAQLNLGDMYVNDRGVLKNEAKAVEWWQKAAAQKSADAQFKLGAMYGNGAGVPKNVAKAVEWFEKAAAQGEVHAQFFLGLLYKNGQDVNRDLVRGYAWLNLASAQGHEGAKEYRDKTEVLMTPVQRAEGQRLSSNWKEGDILQASSGSSSNPSASTGVTATKQGTGTGFVVSLSGHALTNYHVIDGCKEIRAAGLDGVIKVVTSDTVNDLALLQMPRQSSVATLTDNPANLRQGEDVIVYGYPLNSVLSSAGNLTPGTVSALSGMGNNTNQIQITSPIQPGSSGSPVLDKKGNVVGVVSAKLSDSKMAKATGQIGQNVNFAVNGQTVKAFLDANKVSYKTGGGFFSREKSAADIAEEARKWTVVLECWK